MVTLARPAAVAVKPLLERLNEGVLVCDGAMGTMLYARGVFLNRCFDELNLSNPDLVRSVHEEYIGAGAEVVETNTFGAHRFKLGPHGLDGQVGKINREGARVAREAAAGRALVAGSMGPLGKPLEPIGSLTLADAVAAYREQAEGLAEGGVDFFLLETMASLDQARAALEGVRAVSDKPVVASLTFGDEGTTAYGETPEAVVAALEGLGVPVIGANCSQGPAAMLETVKRMAAAVTSARLLAMPNAGAPAFVDGRYVYLCTPEYMASYARRFIAAGVSMVGGCCGTTPAHIRNLVRSVKMLQPSHEEVETRVVTRPREAPAPVAREEKSSLSRNLGKKFVVSVELDPPRGADPGVVLERAHYCKEHEVDAINVADGPRASARMSAQSLCLLMQDKVGIDTILHYTCRDRNLLGIQSDLLGAYALGLRNILAITGDPPKLGDYPDATAVYDVDSIGLIRIMDHLNHGCDLAGQPHRARPRHPRGLRRRPQQARHGEGSGQAREEDRGGGGVRDDPARLRSPYPRALLRDDPAPRGARARGHPAPLLLQERGVPAQRGAGHEHPRGHPRTDAAGGERRQGPGRGRGHRPGGHPGRPGDG